MKKILLSAIAVLAVGGIGGYGYYVMTPKVEANPDYICTATIVNPVCNGTSFGPWINGKRTVTGTRQVSLTYSSRRVSCTGVGTSGEDWRDYAGVYNSVAGWVTNIQQQHVSDGWWWDTGQDSLQYTTEACSYEQIDTSVPSTNTSANPNGNTGGTVETTIDTTDISTGMTGTGN